MIKFIVVTCFLMHFMACGWTYIGLSWDPSPGSTLEWETTWLEKYGYGARSRGILKQTQMQGARGASAREERTKLWRTTV